MSRFSLFFLLLFGVSDVFATPVVSPATPAANSAVEKQNVIVDGRYYDWIVYYVDEIGSEKKCYIASFAKETKGNYKGDRKPYIMIARFNTREIEQISIFADFIYKKNSFIYLNLGNEQTRMVTKDSRAWNKTEEEDRIMITKLVNSDSDIIIVRSESVDGSYTIDTYSLKGFARAYKRMKDLCR